MKKIAFVVLLICFSASVFAQKNQVKLDLLDILVLRTLDVSYEYQLNDEASVGASVFVNFESRDQDFRYHEDFQLVPYFRQFFSHNGNFRFFGELFGTLNFAQTEAQKDAQGNVTQASENYSDFALGLGTGIQHISRNGYVFELNAGLARNLFNADVSREFVPRFGIGVGKQF